MDNTHLSDQVFHHFLALQRFTRQYARRLSDERGLRPGQFSTLRFLQENGPAKVGQIQTFVQKSASTTSSMLAHLEEMGLVTRTRSQTDQRVVIIELTPAGLDIAENTPLGGLPLLRRRMRALPPERLEEIDSVFHEIMRLMEAHAFE